MDKLRDLIEKPIIGGNSALQIIGLFLVVLGSWVLGKVLQFVLRRISTRFGIERREPTGVALEAVASSIVFLCFTLGIRYGVRILTYGAGVASVVDTLTAVLTTLAVGWIIYKLVDVVQAWLERLAARTESRLDDMLVPLVRKSLRVTVVILVLVQVAQILSDKPLTSIIAGLGVTGLAVALAAQDTIKNFFGSIVIFADRPFQVGDRVVVDGHDGPVEEVGFRSTRIRTLDGHLVTIPNGELANKTIQNIGRRPFIKKVMNIGITYDTPPEKVERALQILHEIFDNHEGMHPDFPPRIYFNDFKDWSLNIMVIYWYHPPSYWDFCAFSQRVNLEILKRFNAEGINFAFPSQTVYVHGSAD